MFLQQKNKPRLYLDKSDIHGRGVFTNVHIRNGSIVLLIIMTDFTIEHNPDLINEHGVMYWPSYGNFAITKFGGYINHKTKANGYLKPFKPYGWYFVTSTEIFKSTELTLDYDSLPEFLDRSHPELGWIM